MSFLEKGLQGESISSFEGSIKAAFSDSHKKMMHLQSMFPKSYLPSVLNIKLFKKLVEKENCLDTITLQKTFMFLKALDTYTLGVACIEDQEKEAAVRGSSLGNIFLSFFAYIDLVLNKGTLTLGKDGYKEFKCCHSKINYLVSNNLLNKPEEEYTKKETEDLQNTPCDMKTLEACSPNTMSDYDKTRSNSSVVKGGFSVVLKGLTRGFRLLSSIVFSHLLTFLRCLRTIMENCLSKLAI